VKNTRQDLGIQFGVNAVGGQLSCRSWWPIVGNAGGRGDPVKDQLANLMPA
jgi:hypothetical protein